MRLYPILHVERAIRRRDRDEFIDDALELADRWDGALYIVDRPGLERNKPNIEVYQEMTRSSSLWLDTGAVNEEDVMDAVIIGADRLTVRWDRIWRLEVMLDTIEMVEEGFFVGLPFRDDFVENRRSGPPDLHLLTDKLQKLDAGGLVFIDLDRAGTEDGFRRQRLPDPEKIDVPVWAAGGIGRQREARQLLSRGFTGVLVDTALGEMDPEVFR